MNFKLLPRKISSSKTTLYLDTYHVGVRKCQYLNLCLLSAKTPLARKENKNGLTLAAGIRSEKLIELQEEMYWFKSKNSNNDFFLLLSLKNF